MILTVEIYRRINTRNAYLFRFVNAVSSCSLSETLNMKIVHFQLFISVSSLLPPTCPGAVGGGGTVIHNSCEDNV